MKRNFIFHSSCFDKELFRKQFLCLKNSGIDFKLVNKKNKSSARALLSSFFEAEIYFSEKDFDRVDQLLKEFIKKFS